MTPGLGSDLDGRALRAALTAVAGAHGDDVEGARKAGVAILAEAHDRSRQAVRIRLDQGAGGLETARALCANADELVSVLFDFTTTHLFRASNPTHGERLAVCAVGGYGRGELAPYSDIDLLFVHPWKRTAWVESVVEAMLFSLWDMKLKVGPATRTIDECVRMARKDWTVLTAMMDMRPIAGDAALPVELVGCVAEEFKGRASDFIAAKLDERDDRLARQGAESRYMVEPDVKNGKGSLRDLQLLDWLARGASLGESPAAPAARLFAREEGRRVQAAFEFFWRVRCFMHFIAGRPQDRLSFDIQPEIARAMGATDAEHDLAVERFMRTYFLTARDVGALTRILCAKLEAADAKAPRNAREGDDVRARLGEGLTLVAGRVAFGAPAAGDHSLAEMIALFNAAARNGLDVHPDVFTEAARLSARVTDVDRTAGASAAMFFASFAEPASIEPALRLMNEADVLGAMVPEFGGIVGRTQFNMYHRYTVDEHIIQVVASLAELERSGQPLSSSFAQELFGLINNRRAVYLAALMHDTGKGKGDQELEGARLALIAGRRLGMGEDEAELVAWLVGNHLLMNDIAQRRDIGDPQTVVDFVAQVGSLERLRLLTLLTLADIAGVGPGMLTGWKARLLVDLYDLASAAFRGGQSAPEHVRAMLKERADDSRADLVNIAKPDRRSFTERWVNQLDDAYWLKGDLDDHARDRDAAFAAESKGDVSFVDGWWTDVAGVAEFVVMTENQMGLFARIARAIADNRGDVRDGRITALADGGAVFSVYTVSLPAAMGGEDMLAPVCEAILKAIKTAPTRRPPPQRPRREAVFDVAVGVVIDNEASNEASVVETTGRDRPGLLADLADVFARGRLSVQSAHIASYGERVMDVFYVTDMMGGKVTSIERRQAMREALLRVLSEEVGVAGGDAPLSAPSSELR